MKRILSFLSTLLIGTVSSMGQQATFGTLPGEVAVNNTGQANYSIPITLPPGTSGMVPDLSLSYSSGSGNGHLGVGWSIDGLSAITPDAKNLAKDGEIGGVGFSFPNDRLALDGQRMVKVSTHAYGAVGSEYRTEVESFSRIRAYGSGSTVQYFVVETKAGLKMTYGKLGTAEDAWIRVQTNPSDLNEQVTIAWALKKVEDAAGNYFLIEYGQEIQSGRKTTEFYPVKIRYTGNSAISPYNDVEFQYASGARPDAKSGFMRGGISQMTKLLEKIVLKVEGTTASEYVLTYKTSEVGAVQLLEDVQLVAHSQDSQQPSLAVPKTEFQYFDTFESNEWEEDTISGNPFGAVGEASDSVTMRILNSALETEKHTATLMEDTSFSPVDLLGNGHPYLLKRSHLHSGFQSNPSPYGMREHFDVIELFERNPTSNQFTKINHLELTRGHHTDYAYGGYPTTPISDSHYLKSVTSVPVFADFTGDGKTDIFHYLYSASFKAGTGAEWSRLRYYQLLTYDGSNWQKVHYEHEMIGSAANFETGWDNEQYFLAADLNGSGVAQPVEVTYSKANKKLRLRLFATTKGQLQNPQSNEYFSQKIGLIELTSGVDNPDTAKVMFGDFDGDGLTDLLLINHTSNNFERTRIYRGKTENVSGTYVNKFESMPWFDSQISNVTSSDFGNTKYTIIDYNQDGLSDISKIYVGQLVNGLKPVKCRIYMSNGNDLIALDPSNLPLYIPDDAYYCQYGSDIEITITPSDFQFMDMNNDGLQDLLGYFQFRFEETFCYNQNYKEQRFGYWVGNGDGTFSTFVQLDSFDINSFPTMHKLIPFPNGAGNQSVLGIQSGGGSSTIKYYNPPNIDVPSASQSRPIANTLHTVSNGKGLKTELEYHPINITAHPETGNRIYYKGGGPLESKYPIMDLEGPMPVVTKLKVDTLDANPYTTTYRYQGARMDLEGRGFLGFHHFTSVDEETDVFSQQKVRQDFPATGMVYYEGTFKRLAASPETFSILKDAHNEIMVNMIAHGGTPENPYALTWFPVIRYAEAKSWELSDDPDFIDGAFQGRAFFDKTQTWNWFEGMDIEQNEPPAVPSTPLVFAGSYGNITKTRTRHHDGSEVVSKNTHSNIVDSSKWRLSRMWIADVIHSKPGFSDVIRKSTFSYLSTNGLLVVETLEPDSPDHRVYKFHSRHAQTGDIYRTNVSGSTSALHPFASRVSSEVLQWSSKNRFAQQVADAAGYTETRTYNTFTGAILTSTGPNGKTSTFTYDALGRQLTSTGIDEVTVTTQYIADSSLTIAVPSGVNGIPSKSFYRVVTQSPETPPATVYYDKLGREIRKVAGNIAGGGVTTTGSGDIRTDIIYNRLGQAVAVSEPYYSSQGTASKWNKTIYDPLGRQSVVYHADGTETRYGYRETYSSVTSLRPTDSQWSYLSAYETAVSQQDAHGRAHKVWNFNSNMSVAYNAALPSLGDPDLQHSYDAVGNLIETKPIRNHSAAEQDKLKVSIQYDSKGYFKTSMTDPDMGTWSYEHDALGLLRKQIDAKTTPTTLAYDLKNRMIWKQTGINGGSAELSRWFYYGATESGGTDGKWAGALFKEEAFKGLVINGQPYGTAHSRKAHYYDSLGRQMVTLHEIDGKYFYQHTRYDNLGRVSESAHYWRPKNLQTTHTTLPHVWQSFGTRYTYNAKGVVSQVIDTQDKTWWLNPEYDQYGRVVLESYGNAVNTSRSFHSTRNVLEQIKAGTGGTGSVYWQQVTIDPTGNLALREELNASGGTLRSETFAYDSRHRLTHQNGAVVASYADNGNISNRTSIGDYEYHATKRHAVSSVSLSEVTQYSYSYDNNGQVTSRTHHQEGGKGSLTINWKSFNQVETIQRQQDYVHYVYDANQSRAISITLDTDNAKIVKQLYIGGGLEQEEVAMSQGIGDYNNWLTWKQWTWNATKTRIYINGPTGVIGVYNYDLGGTTPAAQKRHWFHTDHLGSLVAITDHTGAKIQSMSYDPWGLRRDAVTWGGILSGHPAPLPNAAENYTDRGYTGHEMLDNLGLVHMNGRIYDPHIGRFLSPDPFIQFPSYVDSYNRYSYVLNNPLKYTDPSGYFLDKLWKKITGFVKKFWRPIVAIVVGVLTAGAFLAAMVPGATWGAGISALFTGQLAVASGLSMTVYGVSMATAVMAGAVGGFFGGLVATGSMKGALWGAVSGGVAAGIGSYFGATGTAGHEMKRALAHGVSGGAVSSAQGGKFNAGFLSASFASLAGTYSPARSYTGKLISASVVGGTASEIGGGKFENGAVTGAFTYIFNHGLHSAAQGEDIDYETHTKIRRQLNEEGIRRIFGDAAVDDPNFVFTEEMLNGDNLAGETFNRAHPSANAFHSWGRSSKGNVKWTLDEPGKTYGSIEIVLRTNMTLETRPQFMGTYNFGGTDDLHMRLDVKPYLRWGNSPSDPTNQLQRYWRMVQSAPDAALHKMGLY